MHSGLAHCDGARFPFKPLLRLAGAALGLDNLNRQRLLAFKVIVKEPLNTPAFPAMSSIEQDL